MHNELLNSEYMVFYLCHEAGGINLLMTYSKVYVRGFWQASLFIFLNSMRVGYHQNFVNHSINFFPTLQCSCCRVNLFLYTNDFFNWVKNSFR